MRSRCLIHFKNTLLRYSQVILIYGLFSSAHAADLSDGLKGLRVGMTKSEVFSILKDQEVRAGGFFAPGCKPDPLGESCSNYISFLTYGKIPLLTWHLHFGSGARLDGVEMWLSKKGCAGNTDVQHPHPRIQFETLSARLAEHYGTQNLTQSNSAVTSKVWVDEKIKAGLVLSLYVKPQPGIGYSNCPISTISLTTEERIKILNQASPTSSAKEKDI